MKEPVNKFPVDNNIGNYNSGNRNTGDSNTGSRNTGDWNTGDRNSGDFNTGGRNSGNFNQGDSNTGRWNTGNNNTGERNTGEFNTGYWNTGDFNTGGWNTGYCNSITPDECFIFNKRSSRRKWLEAIRPKWMNVSLTKWIEESEMTEKEKEDNPTYKDTGGYLKCYGSLTEAYIESWENTTQRDRNLTRDLPNFDEKVFEEVFGFNPWNKEE